MFPRAHLSRLWAEHPYFDPETRSEIAATANAAELEDRFYKDLEFGTGGLRGVIAAGTNRMNRYTVRQATQGLAAYIRRQAWETAARGVVIAYDSRHLSSEFAREAALILNANGIPAYLWDSLRPTPMLSFAVRELGATAGIVITASHNPPQYNGYKVYWEDGGQAPPELAREIQDEIRGITDITAVHPMPESEARGKGLLRPVPDWVDARYIERVLGLLTLDRPTCEACSVLYTPLHGTGAIPVGQVLTEAGFQVTLVPEQALPDPDFPTVAYPNPEEPEVFALALRQAVVERPDVIMATDPDADRLGVMARDRDGEYRLLTGNQLGAVLVDYLLSRRAELGALPEGGAVVKTIATSNLVVRLCREYGVTVVDTHTGFKFIGDKIREWEETGAHTYLFGFEESYGYLAADFVRDKDAVMAALLVAEATAYHKRHGRTLYEALERIWDQYGHFVEDLHNVNLPGKDGQAVIAQMMANLRAAPPTEFGGLPVRFTDDYATGLGLDHVTGDPYPLRLDKANVLHYRFADGGFVMVRPSGTEPKLKIYFSATGSSQAEGQARLAAIKHDALARLGLGA
ncbi:MAG: phospho-sugar mutase [Symbiobacteriia bacterium]